MKKFMAILLMITIFIIVPLMAMAETKPKNTFEIKFFTGYQICEGMVWNTIEKYKWLSSEVCLAYGWLIGERWRINIEGNVGRYKFETKKTNAERNVNVLGLSAMLSYNFWKISNKLSAYAELGLGIAYWDQTPSRKIMNNNMVPGIIQYGAGLKRKMAKNLYGKIGYRFIHYSAIFSRDSGVNTHGAVATVVYTF